MSDETKVFYGHGSDVWSGVATTDEFGRMVTNPDPALDRIAALEARTLRNLRRRVNRARNFPANTCGASRHVCDMADALARGEDYTMLTDEPEHCAESMYAVVLSLWQARTELAKLKWKK